MNEGKGALVIHGLGRINPALVKRSTQAAPPTPAPAASTEIEAEPGRRPVADPTRVSPNEATQELTPEEQEEVKQLQKRDAEVRTHEQAHAAAGGAHAGAPQLELETGPDGKRYAVNGEVSISTSEIAGDPEASIAKLEQVSRAATAPAQPSGQDMKVAAAARAKIARLRAEMTQATEEELEGPGAEQRASEAYSAAGAPPAEGPTLDLIACGDCGKGHAP